MEQPSAAWHSQTPEQTLRILETDPESGLDPDQAEKRLARYGPNEMSWWSNRAQVSGRCCSPSLTTLW